MGAGTRIDWVLDPNTENPFSYSLTNESGVPVDYTGSTFKLQVKARDGSDNPTGSALLTLATSSGIDGDVSAGEIDIVFPPESSAGLAAGSYIYTLLRLESGVAVEPVFWGHIDVHQGVTSA